MTQDRDDEWEQLARNLVRGQLMTRGMSYAALREALAKIGVEDTEGAIKSKMSRGRFTAVFFLQCMTAIGVEWLHIPGAPDGSGSFAVGPHGAQALAQKKSPTEN
ncbi:DUF6471 domain-containing protein [Erythrobacter colymbi]|uniref:DUF6471 domain-containing protein n=1 Tax=Erythrobacter colymbi TaxID=1161202 RepID=UPI000A388CA6|nr:DUF6471 domain-containing protein [Erythrobacter colymbi]